MEEAVSVMESQPEKIIDSEKWFDDGQINEILFCECFLQRKPLKCINGNFFGLDGMISDQEIEKEIYQMIKLVLIKVFQKK